MSTSWGDTKGRLNSSLDRLRKIHSLLPSMHGDSVNGWDLATVEDAIFHLNRTAELLQAVINRDLP